MASTSYQRSFSADPTLCDRVFGLLDTWIPTLSARRRQAGALSWRWEDVSTPFVRERDGHVIAHVGVLESRLVCLGRERRVGGIHAVCTLEKFRRRGLYRGHEAMFRNDAEAEGSVVLTSGPMPWAPMPARKRSAGTTTS